MEAIRTRVTQITEKIDSLKPVMRNAGKILTRTAAIATIAFLAASASKVSAANNKFATKPITKPGPTQLISNYFAGDVIYMHLKNSSKPLPVVQAVSGTFLAPQISPVTSATTPVGLTQFVGIDGFRTSSGIRAGIAATYDPATKNYSYLAFIQSGNGTIAAPITPLSGVVVKQFDVVTVNVSKTPNANGQYTVEFMDFKQGEDKVFQVTYPNTGMYGVFGIGTAQFQGFQGVLPAAILKFGQFSQAYMITGANAKSALAFFPSSRLLPPNTTRLSASMVVHTPDQSLKIISGRTATGLIFNEISQ